MQIKKYQNDWEKIGEIDPFWGILSDPSKRGRKWDVESFFNTGKREIDDLIQYLGNIFESCNHNIALDFGCGVGRLTRRLSKYFDKAIGVDISASMIKLASELNSQYANCTFIHNPNANLEIFKDASVDFVCSNITLQHIPNRYKIVYLNEFTRILKPDGLLVFQCPSHYALSIVGIISFLLPKKIVRLIRQKKYGLKNVSEMHPLKRQKIENIISSNGLKILKVDSQSCGPHFISYLYVVKK